MTPTFTVLIGSIGRPSLRHTLDAIARQARVPGDQAIVAFDAFEQSADDLAARVAFVHGYGPGFLACVYDSGYHFYGVEQINHALRTLPITGSHVFTLGDDDVFVDGAYAGLRAVCQIAPDRPVLYRFLSPWRSILWDRPRLLMSHISGCCIAAPVAAVGPLPTQTTWPDGRPFVEHDYVWITDILAKSPAPLWLDRVLVIARPDRRGDDVTHGGLVRCHTCGTWRYREDVVITDPYCARCRAVIPLDEFGPATATALFRGASTPLVPAEVR